ncbi:MAG: thioredoxin domain-containing protein, partial [Sciscionella sp.]|nr:thioredoxin domain-containing protein [Sciscionella sp.]
VMAHESFSNVDTAMLMNAHFVNVKVDREERPDIDAVYMSATQAITGQGGWPMTCFLTPNGEPFHCGTYYPPAPRMGMPSFRQLLVAVAEAWRSRGDELRDAAASVVAELAKANTALPESIVDSAVLVDAVSALAAEHDVEHGGFGTAPKFPPTMVLEFLLRHHERTGSVDALSIVDSTAAAMARGGIYDQLAGGFARYSVDRSWTVPHFEKMLYDNALLLGLYAHLARRTGSELARRVAVETGEFLLRELRAGAVADADPDKQIGGAFAASLDADTDGEEGLTYVWTPGQLVDVLGEADGKWAANLFGVNENGTFEHGTSVLRLAADPDNATRFDDVRTRLFDARMRRPQPARDDKVISEWNGLAIGALAEAGMSLRRKDFVVAARVAAEFLLATHLVGDRLLRASRDGVPGAAVGVLADYACLADGLLVLYQATGEARWLTAAVELLDVALSGFANPDSPGAYFDVSVDAERLVNRPADPTDNATPAGASALAGALLTASALTGEPRA